MTDHHEQNDRVKNFTLQIPEEDMQFGTGEKESISSFSDGHPKAPESSAEKEQRKQKRADKRNHRRRSRMKGARNRWLFRITWLVMVLLLGMAAGVFLVGGTSDLLGMNRMDKGTVEVVLPDDPTVEDAAQALYKAGAIADTGFFKLYCQITNNKDYFLGGTFQLDASLDYEGLISALQSQQNLETVKIMFPEGATVLQIAETLEENGVCSAEEVLKACNDNETFEVYDVVAEIENEDELYYKLEGYLFPDTYDFYKGEDVESVLSKMVYNTTRRLTNDVREMIEKSGMTIQQVMTLASIVQAEASDEADMYKIAAILENRLESGASHDIYYLNCDSTTFYPYRTKEDVPEDERETYVSRYDTYTVKGLPAGPINNPGIDAIRAVLDPSSEMSGYYYFCHDKDGNPYYARTSSEHEANMREAGLLE